MINDGWRRSTKPKADLERHQLPRLTGTYDSRKGNIATAIG